MCSPVEIFYFLIIATHFRCTDSNGNFAVLLEMALLIIMIISVFLVSSVGILT